MPLSFVVQLQQELRLHSPHIVLTLSRVSRCQKHADASVASEVLVITFSLGRQLPFPGLQFLVTSVPSVTSWREVYAACSEFVRIIMCGVASPPNLGTLQVTLFGQSGSEGVGCCEMRRSQAFGKISLARHGCRGPKGPHPAATFHFPASRPCTHLEDLAILLPFFF